MRDGGQIRANGTRGFAHTAEVPKSTITVTSTHGSAPVVRKVSVLKENPSGVELSESCYLGYEDPDGKDRGVSMDQFTCVGCGKHLKNIDKLSKHAQRCKKLATVLQQSYNIPTVDTEDLTHLKPKQLPNSNDWGIWNGRANDWVRDKTGQIDSRIFQHNINELLNCVVAASIVTSMNIAFLGQLRDF